MSWRGSLFVWVVLAGCGGGEPESAAVPVPAVPAAAEPVRLTVAVVEGETVAIPVRYRSSLPRSAQVQLVPTYGSASASDILLLDETRVWSEEREGAVELGLLAVRDGAVEGRETLVLRPVALGDDDLEQFFDLEDVEIEVVITDGSHPCSGVEVRVGEPVSREPGHLIAYVPRYWQTAYYTVDIVIEAPVESDQVFEWLSPPDWHLVHHTDGTSVNYRHRTRTFTDWRVESVGERVRHRITAQWRSGREGPWPPLLDLQVCGGAGYGKFIRCSPTECAVHDEGF